MCGIMSIFSMQHGALRGSGSSGLLNDALERGTLVMKHRGPDAQKVWTSPNGQVGLGHTRLSIIDLNTGDQPLVSDDGNLRLVVNGEFYGFEAIRDELEKSGHRFRTKSDSEIALHLYEETGTKCLDRLRGEFAFVLWDDSNDVLFAARDRFGIKPLFYSQHEGKLYLASEIKALFAAGVPARWDYESNFQLNKAFLLHSSRTLFQNVYQVPPGHFILATRDHLQVLKYWDFDYPTQKSLDSCKQSLEENIHRVQQKLHEAVKLRLRADVPVACYLSGGLDSCAALGIASGYSENPIHAFTISFDQKEYDEEAVAKEMATHAGAIYTPISVTPADLAKSFSDAIWHSETVFTNTHGVAKFMLSQFVRDAGYKVVLTGEGSDEIFAGYPHFRRDMLLYSSLGHESEKTDHLLRELYDANNVSQGLLLTGGEIGAVSGIRDVLGFVPSFIETFSGIGRRMEGLINPEFIQPFKRRDPYRVFFNELDVSRQLTGRDPVHQSLYLWSKSFLPNYILSVLGDRMEMGHSIEGRVPFLDHELVELVVSMPIEHKIRGMTEKYLLREAAKPVLTDTVYRRQKHPFLAPPVTTRTNDPLIDMMQDTLRGKSLSSVPFYDQKNVIELLDKLPDLDPAERSAIDPPLMTIFSACILQDRFNVSL